MKNKKYIQELLHFLFDEREKIEATGHRIDPDLRKTHKFISDEIQTLHMMLFEDEYQQFSDRLGEVFDCPSEATKRNQA
jgi:hypothetical protein